MTPVEWAAAGTAIAGLLGILGESAPGVLIALVVLWAYWQREKDIRAFMAAQLTDTQQRETAYAEGLKSAALYIQMDAAATAKLADAMLVRQDREQEKEATAALIVQTAAAAAKAAVNEAALVAQAARADAALVAKDAVSRAAKVARSVTHESSS